MTEIRPITLESIIVRLILSILIGGILGIERGRKNRPAGFRTYILVCLGSAVVMMTNQYVSQCMGTGDPVRMGAQVISGIGFLGAGSILRTDRNQIRGLTTAAGLWAAACVGLAVGIGFYEVAILGSISVYVVLTTLHSMDSLLRKQSNIMDIYIELESKEYMSDFIHFAREAGLTLSNLQLENDYATTRGQNFAFVVTIKSVETRPRDSIIDTLNHIPHLCFMEEL